MKTPDSSYFPLIESSDQLDRVIDTIQSEVEQYIQSYRLNALVLGVSGGIDSALCAALLAPVCKKNGIPLIGRSITIETNPEDEIARSIAIGEAFCTQFEHLDLTPLYFEFRKWITVEDQSLRTRLRLGNVKARMRMMMIYDLAQKEGGIVIGTDNYTEYLTGFWTLHGDVGDYAPLFHLWKTEVYRVAKHFLASCNEAQKAALEACIEATPIDGLGISSHDCEQLGVDNYDQADQIFQAYFTGDNSWENHPLIQKFKNSTYKRENPYSITRKRLLK